MLMLAFSMPLVSAIPTQPCSAEIWSIERLASSAPNIVTADTLSLAFVGPERVAVGQRVEVHLTVTTG